MVKFRPLIWLLSSLAVATALNDAYSSEDLALYSAYKFDPPLTPSSFYISTHKPEKANDKNTPAEDAFENKAAAAGLTGICTFDEFVRHIMTKRMLNSWPFTDNGRTLRPSFDDVIDMFYNRYFAGQPSGKPFNLQYQLGKLLPKRTPAKRTTGRLDIALTGLANYVQTARGNFQGKSPAVQAAATQWLSDFKTYTRIGKQWRLSDISPHYLKFVRKVLVSKGVSNGNFLKLGSAVPILDPDGNPIPSGKQERVPVTYLEPDWKTTYDSIEKSGITVDELFKDGVRSGVAEFGVLQPGQTPTADEQEAIIHHSIINAQTNTENLMDTALHACRAGS
ncbi:hypothetical protein NLG97_g7390 [Lecanicillium saksenae]|uniref:Uncharacterized protein n=1 Tax=Lecanicillium saksenae TaxID=468837 RepID=A0ACC1QNM5_9HYPO|nr:hypothetical protein NLG97_g7390 [Lecanicillium saksenae]